MEKQLADRLRISEQRADRSRPCPRVAQQDPSHQGASDQHAWHTQQNRHATAFGPFLFPRVQQHDGEDEQHHNRAGIDDQLDRGDELSAQQQIFAGQSAHNRDQRKGAIDGMPLRQQVHRSRHANRPESQE